MDKYVADMVTPSHFTGVQIFIFTIFAILLYWWANQLVDK